MSTEARDATSVVADLRAIGVNAGDLLMVHASLRAIGPVADGAAGVLTALRQAVAMRGTLMMVLGARDDLAWVNDRPEDARAALLAGSAPFDAYVTPADPEVGVLAEVFRVAPGTVVSDHPDGRFGASGPLADVLTKDVPWDDYYGPGSPLGRFIEAGGKVLRLGADRNTMTLLHYAESRLTLEPKRRVRRHHLVGGSSGPELRVVDTLDDEHGIFEYPGEDYFEDVLTAYILERRPAQGCVGSAQADLIDGADFVAFGVEWMERYLRNTTAP